MKYACCNERISVFAKVTIIPLKEYITLRMLKVYILYRIRD